MMPDTYKAKLDKLKNIMEAKLVVRNAIEKEIEESGEVKDMQYATYGALCYEFEQLQSAITKHIQGGNFYAEQSIVTREKR